ncbi:bifunctional diguanylate cyclase/phosphodiesterase [Paenibacillus bovis]|uniref:Diguanylate cyclase n=1 Tax=Paenibacillus bovis TaxID=1616788 RepID=A0A172ZCA1_9BACL|nr:bifunctional diguanylate cyclase/phosphodiesterase [Paenibacillus bovis]ANF95159.1 diguanylate cyclase [Paenibacillus bovis]
MQYIHAHYNPYIVTLSVLIAILASYIALNIVGKVGQSTGRNKALWTGLGAFVMGNGIWSMHFIGMLALEADISMSYDLKIVALSAVFSILASLIAFYVTLDAVTRLWKISLGGALMGAGIVAMHYTGMAALHTAVMITYDPVYWLLSLAAALMASYAALLLFRRFRNHPGFSIWKFYSAVVMGLAISGMHYVGMAATQFHYTRQELQSAPPAGQMLLISAVAIVTLFILAASWAAVFVEKHVLERMAYSDPLTGLPNRHGLQRYFTKEFTAQTEGAVLFLDLDRFKSINDTLGHDVGDELLIEVSKRLQLCTQNQGIVFRLGGDEFLIASSSGSVDTTIQLAESILDSIKQPYHLANNQLFITGSIGIALVPQHGFERTFLMRAADTAMYVSKNTGKNKYSIFSEDMNQRQIRRMELEKDLRNAQEQEEFFIVYQPKWDSLHNRLTGMEALLRWKHPQLGIVSPGEFIPIAEETGLIIPMTDWILEKVCEQNKIWQQQADIYIPISVNMSARMFECSAFPERIARILADTGLEPQYLELEITESIAMNGIEGTVEQLQQIQQQGVGISLDDFGTGYSSLGSLDEMPVDIIKIDQVFVRNIDHASKQSIISTIIAIAYNLNMEMVAEGVETVEQIQFLQSKGCFIMQGYYYGKPMTVEQMNQWLEQSADQIPLAE